MADKGEADYCEQTQVAEVEEPSVKVHAKTWIVLIVGPKTPAF